MIEATCHCGAVRVEAPTPPETVTDCNCSICRKLGVLWAYYDGAEITVVAREDALGAYIREGGDLAFHHCRTCDCPTHWKALSVADHGTRVEINARLFDPHVLANARVRHLDGADSWEYLD